MPNVTAFYQVVPVLKSSPIQYYPVTPIHTKQMSQVYLVESSLSCRTRRSCSLLVSPFWSWLMRSWSSLMMAWLSDRVRLRDCTRSFWLDSSSSVFCRLVVKRSMVSWRDWDLDSRFWICLFRASMRSCRTCLWQYKKIRTYFFEEIFTKSLFSHRFSMLMQKISILHIYNKKKCTESKIPIWKPHFSQNILQHFNLTDSWPWCASFQHYLYHQPLSLLPQKPS